MFFKLHFMFIIYKVKTLKRRDDHSEPAILPAQPTPIAHCRALSNATVQDNDARRKRVDEISKECWDQ